MKLLLDTHVWIWMTLKPQRLAPKLRKILEDTRNELWLSPVTFWEFTKLVEKNRLKGVGDPYAWMKAALEKIKPREATFTMEVAFRMHQVRLPQEDPADHFLVATAKAWDLTLVTADEKILAVQPCKTLAA